MSFDVIHYGSYGDEKVVSTAKIGGLDLGACMELPDGRRFRHTLMGAAAAIPGALYEGPTNANANTVLGGGAIVANPNSAPVGANTLTVTVTGTATPASTCALFADGYLCIAASAGNAIGQTYKIKKVETAAAGSALRVTLAENDNITVALQAGTSFVSMIANPYSYANITTGDTVGVSTILGVACATTAASTYCWLQTRGIATCLVDASNPIVGNPVSASTSQDGAVGLHNIAGSAATLVIHQALPVGYALLGSGTTLNHIPVYLTIE